MDNKKDPKFKNWSTICAVLNFITVLVSLIALVTAQWATLSGASYLAAAGAIFATLLLTMSAVLGALVVAMHHAKHHICVKFRHATIIRMISTSAASFFSLISFICFLMEAKIFLRMQSSDRTQLSWSFYFEVMTFLLASVVGMIASVEWRWARKLGGDPTVYNRDPDGTKSDVIVNPNFSQDPRDSTDSKKKPASGGLVHNPNGIAMTRTSGHPYMVTTNGRANGKPNGRVPYDPNRIPARSSLRVKKPPPQQEDMFDLQNPGFTNTSPTFKKKVRIYTQSTAV